MVSKEYRELKIEIEDLKQSMSEQQEILKKIHQAIVGDKEFGQDGLIEVVKKHDKWITAQKYMWAKVYGGIAVGSALGTFLMKYWIKIF
jgi:hypothetical protein|tara:strand:- start:11924 stop:12190 length:267 start_codon:yes stop_codon:yes gene_type:complete